jgi:uncharacterized protein YkwD
MNRPKIFLGGLFTILSTLAAPLFAAPQVAVQAKAHAGFVGQHRYNNQETNVGSKKDKIPLKTVYDEKLEDKILALVNEMRDRKGLDELRLDTRGGESARKASIEATKEGSFDHLSSSVEERLRKQGVNNNFQTRELTRMINESRDIDAAALKIVKGWFKDPVQSRILLDENMDYAGVVSVTYHGESAVTFDIFGQRPFRQPQHTPDCD